MTRLTEDIQNIGDNEMLLGPDLGHGSDSLVTVLILDIGLLLGAGLVLLRRECLLVLGNILSILGSLLVNDRPVFRRPGHVEPHDGRKGDAEPQMTVKMRDKDRA
jgi:hypothetical protein